MTWREVPIGPEVTIGAFTFRETVPDFSQVFAQNAAAPGGLGWEVTCCRKRIERLEVIVAHNLAELAQERARLEYLEAQ